MKPYTVRDALMALIIIVTFIAGIFIGVGLEHFDPQKFMWLW